MSFDFADYLAAKKSVDDRALNRQVLESLVAQLPSRPLQVLEVAAGIGTMLERLVGWGVLADCIYTAVDLQPELIAAAVDRLPLWAGEQGFAVQRTAENRFILRRETQEITAVFEAADVFEYGARAQDRRHWDLLIAHAFLDLVDPPVLLPHLLAMLQPGGLFYFTVNFDGQTTFLPEIDPVLDRQIIDRYHQSMDEGRSGPQAGGSQTGRNLFNQLKAAGGEIIAAGSSDWLVYPGDDGYPQEEAFFLRCILEMIASSVTAIAPEDIQSWISRRQRQIDEGELIFIAHQLDFAGRRRPG